ncbi:dipeptide epimerase [bacterium]|nr:dipeptide epimerase [bacterium]
MRLSYTTYRLKCIHPFGISRSSYDYYDRVFIYLEQDGFIGRGEAAPSERYNESIPQILEILKSHITLPKNVTNIDEIIEIFDRHTINIKSFRSACLNALFDWWTQQNNIPLHEYYNYSSTISQPTSFTIAIGNINELEKKIEEAKEYKILKVKLGTSQDKEIISIIRKYTDKPIRVDANEGWDLETAIKMTEWLSDKNIELIEQPLPADDIGKMGELKNHSSLPLIADENCRTAIDIEKLVKGFDGINIKLAKCGGVDEALRMIETAKQYNLKVMFGCMVESSIGITALGQLASQAEYLDLDGNLMIKNDPYNGLRIVNGFPVLPEDKGLGLSLKYDYQNEFPE